MRTLDELLVADDPAIGLIRQWLAKAENSVEILPPSDDRNDVLLELQVTTHSTLGAIAYETGGILIDDGWLRVLGSGHPRLPRSVTAWNHGRSNGLLLVADDAVGGFFAINGGALGDNAKAIYYWSSDRLDWECLDVGFTDFFQWSLTARLADFYADLRWPTWREDTAKVSADQCFSFYPFLWTKEGSVEKSDRRPVPVHEVFDLKIDIVQQLQRSPG